MVPDKEILASQQIVDVNSQTDHVPWSAWTRRLIPVIGIIAVIIGLLLAGPICGQVVVASALCLFLLVPLRAVMQWTRLRYHVAMIVTLVGYIVGAIVLFILLAAAFVDLASRLIDGVNRLLAETTDFAQSYTPESGVLTDSARRVVVDLDPVIGPFIQNAHPVSSSGEIAEVPNLNGIITSSIGVVFGSGGALVGFAYNQVFANFLALFFLAELPNFYQWMMRSLSSHRKRQIGVLLARFNAIWTAYLRGAGIISASGAVLTWILLTLLGIPNAVGITLITTILLLIPFYGPMLGAATCFIAEMASGPMVIDQSPFVVSIIAAVLFLVRRGFIVGNSIYSRIVGKSVGVPGVIVLVATPFFGALGGILGMFLSPVLAAIMIDLGAYIHAKMNGREPFPDDRTPQFMFTNMLHPGRTGVQASTDQAR